MDEMIDRQYKFSHFAADVIRHARGGTEISINPQRMTGNHVATELLMQNISWREFYRKRDGHKEAMDNDMLVIVTAFGKPGRRDAKRIVVASSLSDALEALERATDPS